MSNYRAAQSGVFKRWVFAIILGIVSAVGLSGCGSGGGDGTDAAASASAQEAFSRRSRGIAPSVPTDLSAEAVSSAQIDLSWSPSTDNRGVASYTVRRNGSRVATVTDDTSYEDTGLTPRTTYSYTVEAVDLAGNVSGQSTAATATTPGAETRPPSVTSTSPLNGATSVGVNSSIKVTFSETILKSTITTATFKLATSGGTAVPGVVSVTSTSATFTPSYNLSASTTYRATISTGVTDAAGNNLRESYVWAFRTGDGADTTPPSVSSVSPANAASGVALNASVSATFSEAMTTASLTSKSFTVVKSSGGASVGGIVSISGNTARFTPSASLLANTQYTATITTAVKDAAGNALRSNYIWSFSTATTTSTTPPRVIATLPATGATDAALNSAITATFSEQMTNSTLTTSSFKLATASGTAVVGTVTVSGNSVGFKPLVSLVAGTKYTATITTAAKDSTGTAMAANYVWTFATAALLDTTPPVVSSGSPASGATAVAVTTPISATFSEPMENSTLTTATFLVNKTTGGAAVAGTVKVSGNTATFTPSAALAASTQYTATITTGAADASDNELAKTFAWSFTTAAAPSAAPTGAPTGGGSTPNPPPTTTACSNSTGQPKLSVVATRTSGVAPLMVSFDASGTTSPLTTRPFHDVEYRWDFGDTASGFWATGSRPGTSSRNSATGPIAAHVFETPGTYTIAVTGVDGTNTSACSLQVVVASPDTVFAGSSTICFSAAGNFTGCPSGSTNVTTSDFDTAINSYKGTNRRLLFHRGETFTASSSASITVTGPGLIGAYGTGALPQINASGSFGNSPIVVFGNSSSVTQKDWRVMDLSFNGNNSAEAIGMSGGFDQVTILRVNATNCGDACIFFNSAVLNVNAKPHLFDQAAIVDSTVTDPSSWGVFFNGKNFAIMGNTIDNQLHGSHVLRISIAINGVVSNNTLANNGPGSAGTHVLKLHGPPWGSATDGVPVNTATSKVVVSDNKLSPGNASTNNWTFSLDPQDSAENEHITDVIVERNQFAGGSNTSLCISMQAIDVTVRNNLANTTGSGAGGTFIEVDKRSSGAPAPNRIAIYNNTAYSSANNIDSGSAFIVVTSSTTSGGATVKNNLGYAPNASSPAMVSGSNAVASNNSTNAQLKTNPGFASSLLSAVTNFQVLSSSYAKGTGTTVPVFSDFFRVNRAAGVGDLGFSEIP